MLHFYGLWNTEGLFSHHWMNPLPTIYSHRNKFCISYLPWQYFALWVWVTVSTAASPDFNNIKITKKLKPHLMVKLSLAVNQDRNAQKAYLSTTPRQNLQKLFETFWLGIPCLLRNEVIFPSVGNLQPKVATLRFLQEILPGKWMSQAFSTGSDWAR